MLSLSRDPAAVLKDTLVVDGVPYGIDASFRTVLACLRVSANPDKTQLDKAIIIAKLFFGEVVPPDMTRVFGEFITDGETSEDSSGEQVMDFELDADAIYASFRQQYGINLLADNLHWYEFKALLAGLGEDTPFGRRVKIRSLDINDVPEKDRSKLRKLKDILAIKPAMSKEEAALNAELDRRLAAGEDPSEILKQLQQGV